MGVSLAVHLGVAVAAWRHDRPEDRPTWGVRAEEMSVDTISIDAPDLFEVAPPPDEGAATPATPAPETPAAPSATPPERRTETDPTALREEAIRYAAALAAAGRAEGGVDGEMGTIAPGGDLDDQIDETRDSDARVEVGGGGERGPRDDGAPRDGTVKDRPIDAPDGPERTVKTENAPKSRIEIKSKKTFDETTLSPEAVTRRILDVYMTGLQRCQKDLLNDDPTARARVDLSFTVNESGRTTSPDAKSEYPSVDRCIEQRMTGWTFPAPRDAAGEETEASFAVTLALQPDS